MRVPLSHCSASSATMMVSYGGMTETRKKRGPNLNFFQADLWLVSETREVMEHFKPLFSSGTSDPADTAAQSIGPRHYLEVTAFGELPSEAGSLPASQ